MGSPSPFPEKLWKEKDSTKCKMLMLMYVIYSFISIVDSLTSKMCLKVDTRISGKFEPVGTVLHIFSNTGISF